MPPETPDSPASESGRPALLDAVRGVVITESRLPVVPADIPEDEPLNGSLLTVNSVGLLGMLMRLEDHVGVPLPDDLFVGRRFETVADLVDVVESALAGAR